MKYWVYMNGEVPGNFTPAEMAVLDGFTVSTLVCPAEGEIQEKNWRHSGEFPDILIQLQEMQRKQSHHAASADTLNESGLEEVLNASSTRIFRHVADLMKELETRRGERSAAKSMENHLAELREQLGLARQQLAALESRAAKIPELEDSLSKALQQTQSLESSLKAKEENLSQLRVKWEMTRSALENTERQLSDTTKDLAIRNRLVEKLNRELSDKDLALAKSLAVIRRFENELSRICLAETAPPNTAPTDTPPQGIEPPRPPKIPPAYEPDKPAHAPATLDAPSAPPKGFLGKYLTR